MSALTSPSTRLEPFSITVTLAMLCVYQSPYTGRTHRHLPHQKNKRHFWGSNLQHLHLAGLPVEMLSHCINPPPIEGQFSPCRSRWCTLIFAVTAATGPGILTHPSCSMTTASMGVTPPPPPPPPLADRPHCVNEQNNKLHNYGVQFQEFKTG